VWVCVVVGLFVFVFVCVLLFLLDICWFLFDFLYKYMSE